jgi:hypothetical protein
MPDTRKREGQSELELTTWCGTRRSFFGGIRCADERDILNSTIEAGPSRTEQNVSYPARGVLVHFSRQLAFKLA